MTIGIHDKIGGSSNGFLSLSQSIERSGGNIGEENQKYNSSAPKPKMFDGNIKLFARNPFQYKKRFNKNECCTSENMIEWKYKGNEKDPFEYRYNEEFKNNSELKHKDFIGDILFVCKKCGYVEEEKSNVREAEEIKVNILSKLDRAIFKDTIEQDNEPEPDENEIRKLAKEYGF